jgi:hypothetical protein
VVQPLTASRQQEYPGEHDDDTGESFRSTDEQSPHIRPVGQ